MNKELDGYGKCDFCEKQAVTSLSRCIGPLCCNDCIKIGEASLASYYMEEEKAYELYLKEIESEDS